MPLSRSNTQASGYQSSPSISSEEVPGGYPDTEAARAVSTQQTLSEAIHARRAEFTRPHTIRIKVGTWNAGGKKGTVSDIGGWFVKSKGVDETLNALDDVYNIHLDDEGRPDPSSGDQREGITEQEARVAQGPKRASTVPEHDASDIPSDGQIGLYVLGLQEIVDISSPAEALRPYHDPAVSKRWKENIEHALPQGYQCVAQHQLTGLMMLIYASPSVRPQISSVSTTSCGTGVMGVMGNKGAVTTRLVLGETTRLVFINSHLSSGLGRSELDRRNWDARQIVAKTQYDPIVDSLGYVSSKKERIGDEDFAFWFGDLNYRIEDVSGHEVRRLLTLHARNEYDLLQDRAAAAAREHDSAVTNSESDERRSVEFSPDLSSSTMSSPATTPTEASFDRTSVTSFTHSAGEDEPLAPSSDPSHLQTTLDSLLAHDELRRMQKQRRMFHDGWREGPVTFLPTYKYDVGSVSVFDSTDKKRGPSWCDRILYRTRKDKTDYENLIIEEQEAQRKDKELEANGVDKAASEENTLYEYDPDTDADEAQQDNFVTGDEPLQLTTHEGYTDLIQLEYYVSHQRVLSSDHKPLDAVFKLEYDAVVPELKSQVHQQVARDLDRAENEARPLVTLVADRQTRSNDRGSDSVHFENMHYEEEVVQTLTLANIGRVNASFGFLCRQQENSSKMAPTPEWLTVSIDTPSGDPDRSAVIQEKPKTQEEWAADILDVYSLEPGCTCTIRVTACVRSKALARRLNDGGALDDVLILRIKEGRDHFVLVDGTWSPTVIGRSISELIRVPEGGIRMFWGSKSSGSGDDSGTAGNNHSTVSSSAPRELFRLTRAIEAMTERALAESSMLQNEAKDNKNSPWIDHAGWPFEGWKSELADRHSLRLEITKALDSGHAFEELWPADVPTLHRLEALCEALLVFLDSLSDGIITDQLWTRLVQNYFMNERSKLTVSRDDQRAVVLEILSISSPHSVSFVLLTSTLSALSQEIAHSAQNHHVQEMPASSPKAHVRRKTLSVHPSVARRQLVQKSYAAILADVVVRLPENTLLKAQTTSKEQSRELLEMFLEQNSRPD
ncbi:MAG: hypothetical protein Q9162_007148 [Coniocarpon cinnabarinum]